MPVTVSRGTNSIHRGPRPGPGSFWKQATPRRTLSELPLFLHVASNARSLPVLCFILALAECINRREHLAEWHHEMGPSCSAKYHRELFIRGINLLFHVCFVVGLCCIFKFTLFPVSSQGT